MAEFRPLPSGRHGLTREQVQESQRDRLVRGMTEVVAEQGYPAATVAAVLRRVHVSRQTYYEHFTDKQDCFLAVLDESARRLATALAGGVTSGGDPAVRLERLVTAYFTALDEHPAQARVFFVESTAAGPPAQLRRVRAQDMFVELVAGLFRDTAYWRVPDPEFACRILVGGISSLVTASLVADGTGPPAGTADRVVALAGRLFGPP